MINKLLARLCRLKTANDLYCRVKTAWLTPVDLVTTPVLDKLVSEIEALEARESDLRTIFDEYGPYDLHLDDKLTHDIQQFYNFDDGL